MESCNCQQTHWFWKWTFRILFIALFFLIVSLLFTVWDIRKELKETNSWAEKDNYTIEDWTKIFNRVGEYIEQTKNRKLTKSENKRQWKKIYTELKPNQVYLGLTKREIERMLRILGCWN